MDKPSAGHLTITEVKATVATGGGLYKYVKVNGEYRFADVSGPCPSHNHRSLAAGDDAQSAATISIFRHGLKIKGCSTTLGVGYDKEDLERIPRLLGLPLLDN